MSLKTEAPIQQWSYEPGGGQFPPPQEVLERLRHGLVITVTAFPTTQEIINEISGETETVYGMGGVGGSSSTEALTKIFGERAILVKTGNIMRQFCQSEDHLANPPTTGQLKDWLKRKRLDPTRNIDREIDETSCATVFSATETSTLEYPLIIIGDSKLLMYHLELGTFCDLDPKPLMIHIGVTASDSIADKRVFSRENYSDMEIDEEETSDNRNALYLENVNRFKEIYPELGHKFTPDGLKQNVHRLIHNDQDLTSKEIEHNVRLMLLELFLEISQNIPEIATPLLSLIGEQL